MWQSYLLYGQTNPGQGAVYFQWDQKEGLATWIDQNKGQVEVVGHSYGGDTAASVVANGHFVVSLVTIDPVSWIRPDFSAVVGNVGAWTNYNSTSGQFTFANFIAFVGGAWGSGPRDFANRHTDVNNYDHADIGYKCSGPSGC